MDLGYYVLYLHHGFGNKRIVRLERTINEYLERAQTENEMKIETLRDMGDEELADILFDSCIDHIEVSSCERMFEKDSCKECVLNWLQSEAE